MCVLGGGATFPATEACGAFPNVGIDTGLTNIDKDEGDSIKNRALFASFRAAIPIGSGG